jgi:hypothetical protein
VAGCGADGTCRPSASGLCKQSYLRHQQKSGAMEHYPSWLCQQNAASWFGKPKRSVSRVEFISQTLNAPTDPCQISLRPMAGTRAHPRPRQWPWLAADGFASCPLLQRLARSFFPWATPIPRGNKKPRSAPSSTALRPCGCSRASPCLKPAIEAANERGVRPT